MHEVELKNVSRSNRSFQANAATPIPHILVRVEGQNINIVDGILRASLLSDLGRPVPVMDIETNTQFLMTRNSSGEWIVAPQTH